MMILDELINATRPKDTDYAYRMGYDCAVNGANETNCNFTIFGTQAGTQAWERGKRDGEKDRRLE